MAIPHCHHCTCMAMPNVDGNPFLKINWRHSNKGCSYNVFISLSSSHLLSFIISSPLFRCLLSSLSSSPLLSFVVSSPLFHCCHPLSSLSLSSSPFLSFVMSSPLFRRLLSSLSSSPLLLSFVVSSPLFRCLLSSLSSSPLLSFVVSSIVISHGVEIKKARGDHFHVTFSYIIMYILQIYVAS